MQSRRVTVAARKGCQVPTQSAVLPYVKTYGNAAVKLYKETGRKAIRWQTDLLKNIMGVGKDGLWVHQKFGYSIPRRNGKNEIAAIRELWGLKNGETICHTAHRTSTSHSAWVRLCRLLVDSGYTELGRPKQDEALPEKSFRASKQYGLETIRLTGGGEIAFRTRTPNGGLGEGFDLLVIDEAQEYTEAQESALIYTVSDSKNPQTIFCGTPPTAASSGTVFMKMRDDALSGAAYDTGWAEWSLPEMTDDVMNKELWLQTNPSLGYHLSARTIRSEIRKDKVDFNIQRLGVWITYSQKSAISAVEWESLKITRPPTPAGKLYCGIKFSKTGEGTAFSVAVRTKSGKIFIECLDCRPFREGVGWIVQLLKKLDCDQIVLDGSSGQEILQNAMKDAGIRKKPVLPTVKEYIAANAAFEQAVFSDGISHAGQPDLSRIAANCEHRPIGSSGGFGYKALTDDGEVSILDSAILAFWACSQAKKKTKQTVRY